MAGMRSALLPLLLLASKPCLAQSADSAQSVITIFRGKPASAFAGFTSRDAWGKRLHGKISIDGKPVVDIHNLEFVSFPVTPGRHLVAFTNYGPGSASVDLKPGERVYIYPQQFIGPFQLAQNLSLTVLPCTQAVDFGRDAKPASPKDTLSSGALDEKLFPSECSSDHP